MRLGCGLRPALLGCGLGLALLGCGESKSDGASTVDGAGGAAATASTDPAAPSSASSADGTASSESSGAVLDSTPLPPPTGGATANGSTTTGAMGGAPSVPDGAGGHASPSASTDTEPATDTPTATEPGEGDTAQDTPTSSAEDAGQALPAEGDGGPGTNTGSEPLGTPHEDVLPSLDSVLQEHSVVALKGEVYVIGGYNPQITDKVQAYNPSTMQWRDVAPFPEAINHPNAAVVRETLYVTGYYHNGSMYDATADSFAYDPDADEWTPVTPMPSIRAASCMAVDGDLIYVIGGANAMLSVADNARYSASNDSWEELPALPERREHCVAGVIDGIVYVAGGRADGIEGIEEKTWAFDPEAMEWTEKTALSPPRGGLAGAVLKGRLVVFGGEGNEESEDGVFPDVDAYDPKSDSWEALPPMLVPRHGYGAATLDDRIYLMGGASRQGGGAADDCSVFYFE